VSADYRRSSAAPFIEPLLAARDAERFHVVCYNSWRERDEVTERFAALADDWREVAELSDTGFAKQVRADAIDILVDLNGHTTGNRLPAFGPRLAPVQATYLGYAATTGVAAIDYRITDAVLDPPGRTERYYSERLLRLPDAMWCYTPPQSAPEPAAGRETGAAPTFGVFNNFAKVSPAAIETWAEILAQLPHARLLCVGVPSGSSRARFAAPFEARGVDPERLTFTGRASYAEYLDLHQRVDIALDSFPYTGGTTTCDALWMGVPVLSLAGDAVPARSGASLLSAIGLSDWVAQTREDYVARALQHAGAHAALEELHRTLRARMAASPLCDRTRFMRAFEDLLRRMWREWCAVAPPGPQAETLFSQSVRSAEVIEIVSATRLPEAEFWEKSPLGTSLRRLKGDARLVAHIAFENTRGLPDIYNAAIEAQDGHELLVFMHDDVWIDDHFVAERVIEALKTYDVIGVAGNRRRLPGQPGWGFVDEGLNWDAREHLSGTVAHGQKPFENISFFGPAPADCELLDGAFLAARRSALTAAGVRFDPRFEFHFYDMDFCRSARRKGLRLGTWPICVTHQSGGGFGSDAWREKYRSYLEKWND
jgi:protein O-GlcNAc transferase